MKNNQKINEICYCLGGGGDSKLRGEMSPPLMALKKHCLKYVLYACTKKSLRSPQNTLKSM